MLNEFNRNENIEIYKTEMEDFKNNFVKSKVN